jgi:hypothetical protein
MNRASIAVRFLFTAWLAGGLASASTMLSVDFADSTNEVHQAAKGRFDGVLPAGCSADFPGWNSSVASSKLLTEGERTFLRFNVTKLDASVQFSWPLPKLQVPGNYRVTVVCRLPDSGLGLSFRQLPAPYKTFWSASVPMSEDAWCTKTFLFTLDQKSDHPLGLFLYPHMGTCDMASILVESLTFEEVANSLQRPPKTCRNSFRNSRFPLGLQAGWNLSREYTSGWAGVDPANPGPSGFPSLKLTSEETIALFTEPFQTAEPFAPNNVSLACKGTGEWKLSILCAKASGRSRQIASKTIQAGAKWQTETIAFRLDDRAKVARAFALKIEGTGTLSIDSLQAWAGEPGPRAYASQGECEVALAVPASDYSDTRIQFADEKPLLRFCVTGPLAGATLKLRVVNALGEARPLPDVELGKLREGDTPLMQARVFNYGVFPEAPLGQFRVEAHVARDGKRISPFNEILVTRIRRPVHLNEDAPNSPFGCHFMASPLMVRTMKAAGVNWARFHDAGTEYIGWYHLEPEKGKWEFRDDAINVFRKNRIRIFAGLQTAPTWSSLYLDSGKQGLNGYFDRYFQPRNLDEWSNYVRTVTRRYQGVIDDFFIWNEPWGDSFWHTVYNTETKRYEAGPTAAADFAKLSIATYAAAKEGNPAARVSGFNTYGGEKGKQWTKDVFAGGAYPGCDLVDYHFYTSSIQGFPGDQAQEAYDNAIGPIKEQVPDFAKPVWMSEGQGNSTGSTGGGGFGLYRCALTWKNEGDALAAADKTCRYVVANLAAGAKKVFLYTAHGYECLARAPAFLTLVGPDGYPHVELAAFSNLAWHIEDSTFVRCVSLSDDVCAYLFQGKHTATAIVSGQPKGRLDLPSAQGLAVRDLFGNAVHGVPRFAGRLLYIRFAGNAEDLRRRLTER